MIKLPLAHVTKDMICSLGKKPNLEACWKCTLSNLTPRPTESKARQNLQDIHMLIKVLEIKTSVYSSPIPVCVCWGMRVEIRRKSGREEEQK